MKLCAIFNVWKDTECIFTHALKNIEPLVDGVIVIYSNVSNHGVFMKWENFPIQGHKVKYYLVETRGDSPQEAELNKRNFGLEKAKQLGFTHFLMMDGDEFYEADEFNREIERIKENNFDGVVCRTKVYIKSPTLTIGYDSTLVPFVHKITSKLRYTFKNRAYPFAKDAKGDPKIDPTRRLNIMTGVVWSNITMHHYSYVRRNIDLKITNSSANLRRSAQTIREEIRDAKPGYVSRLYHKEIFECENIFNMPEL